MCVVRWAGFVSDLMHSDVICLTARRQRSAPLSLDLKIDNSMVLALKFVYAYWEFVLVSQWRIRASDALSSTACAHQMSELLRVIRCISSMVDRLVISAYGR